jgi:hypothetical protein
MTLKTLSANTVFKGPIWPETLFWPFWVIFDVFFINFRHFLIFLTYTGRQIEVHFGPKWCYFYFILEKCIFSNFNKVKNVAYTSLSKIHVFQKCVFDVKFTSILGKNGHFAYILSLSGGTDFDPKWSKIVIFLRSCLKW